MDIVSVETAAASYEASLIPIGSVADLCAVAGDAMVSWAIAPVLAVMEHGHGPMTPLSKWLRLYILGTAFSAPVDAPWSLLSPRFASVPNTEHISIDDEPVATATMPCVDFAEAPTAVTCT